MWSVIHKYRLSTLFVRRILNYNIKYRLVLQKYQSHQYNCITIGDADGLCRLWCKDIDLDLAQLCRRTSWRGCRLGDRWSLATRGWTYQWETSKAFPRDRDIAEVSAVRIFYNKIIGSSKSENCNLNEIKHMWFAQDNSYIQIVHSDISVDIWYTM